MYTHNRRPSHASPEIRSRDGLYGPYGAPSANPFETDDVQQQRRSSGIHVAPPAAASLYREAEQYGYSPIPFTGYPYGRVPKRKSIPSQNSSTHTLPSVASGVPASNIDLQQLLPRPEEPLPPPPAVPKIHWFTPFSMVGLFLLGVLSALTHHLFYASLHGHDARDQLKKIRYGTAMAVFTKATLVGSVVVAYRQRIWYTLRRKALSLGAIGGLFAAADDPVGFLMWDMWKDAKVATAMACAVWLIPIAAVLSPAALTTTVSVLTNTTTCPSAFSLNFTAESDNDFRNPRNISGFFGISLSYFNTTYAANSTEPKWFDYWDQPSKNAVRLAIKSRYWKKPIERDNASTLACGAGWNCTYTVSFKGPGYKCSELADGIDANSTLLAKMNAPFNTTSLVPQGKNIYLANVDQNDYADPQLPVNEHGELIQGPPWPPDLGVFKAEPLLWIGYTVDTKEKVPDDSPYKGKWETIMIPKIFQCKHYETAYTVLFNYTGGTQESDVVKKEFLRPVINTTTSVSGNGSIVLGPSSGFVRPDGDVYLYKLTAAYHSLGSLLRAALRGSIEHDQSWPVTKSDVTETKLVDQSTFYPVPDLQTQLQSFYEDLILTLLSDPHLVIASKSSVPCTKSRNANLFDYRTWALWPGYAVVIAISLIFLIIGLLAMWNNGVASDTGFMQVMFTTRNPTLDSISKGQCLGGVGTGEKDLEKVKLKFGVLRGAGREGVEHCAFGLEREIDGIIKGLAYAGLEQKEKEKVD